MLENVLSAAAEHMKNKQLKRGASWPAGVDSMQEQAGTAPTAAEEQHTVEQELPAAPPRRSALTMVTSEDLHVAQIIRGRRSFDVCSRTEHSADRSAAKEVRMSTRGAVAIMNRHDSA